MSERRGGPLTVLTAVVGPWEAPIVTALEGSPAGVRVVRRCVDLGDLLSAAAAGLARAVLLSADLQRLDREAVAALRGAGLAVLGLVDPADSAAAQRLQRLGVARVLPADAPIEEVVAAVARAVEAAAAEGAEVRIGTGDPGDALPPGPDAPAAVRVPPPGGGGRLVAVWGPTGAPGRTTVAVTLGTEFAAAGFQALVVDADTYGASVAQALGLLDESAGLAAAARLANQGALDVERLLRLAPLVTERLRVLTGLPQPRRWPELRAAALELVWQHARAIADWVVVDCGFSLEADEELTFDTAAPRRNGATLSVLREADVVLAVGGCDPVGVQRLVRGLHDLREVVAPGEPQHVVVTRTRSSSVGAAAERQVADALGRYSGVERTWLVPDDRTACDAALLAGRSLTECAPRSPARIALGELAAEIAGRPGEWRRPPRRSLREILRRPGAA